MSDQTNTIGAGHASQATKQRNYPGYQKGYSEAGIRRHGITPEQYLELANAQEGVCAICLFPQTARDPKRRLSPKRLVIDHNHGCCSGVTSCGKCIRGLLCDRCNQALGLLWDDQRIITRMLSYLAKFHGDVDDPETEYIVPYQVTEI